MCVNMRVGTQLASVARRMASWLDPTDLCYRNILFNQEKMKYRRIVDASMTGDSDDVSCVDIDHDDNDLDNNHHEEE